MIWFGCAPRIGAATPSKVTDGAEPQLTPKSHTNSPGATCALTIVPTPFANAAFPNAKAAGADGSAGPKIVSPAGPANATVEGEPAATNPAAPFGSAVEKIRVPSGSSAVNEPK